MINYKRLKIAIQLGYIPSIDSKYKDLRKDALKDFNMKSLILRGYREHIPEEVSKEVVKFLIDKKVMIPENSLSVSFDFDGTLSLGIVQDYCKDLIMRGYSIYVTTFRYNQMLKHLYPSKPHNEDLFEVTDRIGIPRENIIFTNNRPKSFYLNNSNCIFHLDDELGAVTDVRENTKVISVDVTEVDWKKKCEIFLRNYEAL